MNLGLPDHDHQFAAALNESAEELYEMAPCGYLTTTIDGRIAKVNRTLAEWLGYEQDNLIGGKRFVDLLTVGGRMFYETHFNLLLRMQKSVDEVALDLVGKDGRILPVLINARQKRSENDEPVLNRFTVFNSSERRAYERQLLAARDLYRTTLASIADGVITTDAAGRITFLNVVAEEISGWKTEAAAGKPIEDVLILRHESSFATVENPITRALRDGVAVGLASHTILVLKDGRKIPIDDSASPIRDSNGYVTGGVLVFRDITNRSIEEAQLRETAKLESLGVLAGGIAHDFNNLLTGVLGNASILKEFDEPEVALLAGYIVEAAERAADLTRQMLAYSGKGRFVVKRMNLSTTVLDVLKLIQFSIEKKVELVLSLDENLPLIEADPGQMQQVLMNLVINGSEAMEGREGKVLISTAEINADGAFNALTFRSGEPSLTAGHYVAVEVHDTGCGMNEATLSRIFDPFFTTKFTGRGLGLAALSGIVRGHRGAVQVSSQVGNGTTFKVFFPVAETLKTTVAIESVPQVGVVAGWGNVLLVDDEETVRRVGKIALERNGYDVMLAENGKLAVDLFKQHSGNLRLVILDLTMPVMGGEEAMSLLREIDPCVPILLSSGYNQVEIIRRFTTQHVNGFIQKPYSISQLTNAVTKVLQGKNLLNN